MVDVTGFTFVIHIGWLVVFVPRPRKAERGIWKCRTSVRLSVRPSDRPRYVVSTLRLLFVDQLISNLHTSILLGISSLSSKMGKRCLPKHIKISKCYNFNEN